MLKKLLIILAVVALFAAPFVGRALYYYAGLPKTRTVPRPDLSQVSAPAPHLSAFAEQPAGVEAGSGGVVLVDRAHENRFSMGELNVLQARLAARGQRLEIVESADTLAARLRDARSLLILSPGRGFEAGEIDTIVDFVGKGGRLLLAGDPARYSVLLDDYGDYAGLDMDSAHLNDLAAEFGLVFQPDYLYNTVENEGNFRNIRLTDIATGTLTAGLQQVVFYGAHSILTAQPALLAGSGDTRSSSSEHTGPLVVAVLAGNGSVLALGDTTFMSEPYNATYDNDRLVANVADFLSGAERRYDLADFPFFFGPEVDLVYAGDPVLDADLLKGGSALQDLFEQQGRVLAVRAEEDGEGDTLFFGLYREAGEVQPYLDDAGVTLVISSTAPVAARPEPPARESVAISPTLTGTVGISHTAAITPTAPLSPTESGRVSVTAVGSVALSGTALLLLQDGGQGERQVLIVLAGSEAGLDNAVERLSDGSLEECVLHQTEGPPPGLLALCPTGEADADKGTGGWSPEKPSTPAPAPGVSPTGTVTTPVGSNVPQARVFIVSLDGGQGRYDGVTDAADYADILTRTYEVTLWSEAKQGLPSLEDLGEPDLVIWAAGDFKAPLGEQESNLLLETMMLGVPAIISGGYLDDAADEAPQNDVRVVDADHPVLEGFTKNDVIEFIPSPSGQEYALNVMDPNDNEGAALLLVRGPGSASAGAPAAVAMEDELGIVRIVFIGFPLYLLPDEPKEQLVKNAVRWTVGE